MGTLQGRRQNGKTPALARGSWTQILIGVAVGAILGAGSTFFALQGRVSRLEGMAEQLRSGRNAIEPAKPSARPSAANPDELVSIIHEQQKLHVKESWGELASQCFTDNDLTRFIEAKSAERIATALKRDPRFLDVVLAIRQMEPGKRGALLIAADKPLRPTWAELGGISRDGQTEAGQKAEQIVASAIVALVRELVGMSDERFLRLYNE